MMSIAAVMSPYSAVTNNGIYRLTIIIDIRKLANILVDGQALTTGDSEYLLPLEEHARRGREPGVHDELDESLVNLARRYAGLQRTMGVIAQQRALALGGQ